MAGIIGHDRQKRFADFISDLDRGRELMKSISISPSQAAKQGLKLNQDGQRRSVYEMLAYPDITMETLTAHWPELRALNTKVAEVLEIEASYAVYMQRQSADIVDIKRDEDRKIPNDFDFQSLSGLSNELKQKLEKARPENIAQAARVDGMTPAAISLLLALLRKGSASGSEKLRMHQ